MDLLERNPRDYRALAGNPLGHMIVVGDFAAAHMVAGLQPHADHFDYRDQRGICPNRDDDDPDVCFDLGRSPCFCFSDDSGESVLNLGCKLRHRRCSNRYNRCGRNLKQGCELGDDGRFVSSGCLGLLFSSDRVLLVS